MEDKIVKTISGKECPEKDCRLINGCYYLVGNNNIENSGDVYLINGRYIRESTGRVVFDHFEKEYKLKNNTLIEGIIGYEDDKVITGYFTRNDLYNVRVVLKDGTDMIAIAPNVLGYTFREKKYDGIYYHISLLEASKFSILRNVTREVKESLPYDSKGVIDKALKHYEAAYNPVICNGARTVGEALKHYTFGLEFETSKGIIPNAKMNILPLIPLRDGSIDGLEYVTVPLQGPKGVQAVIDSVDELKRRTMFNDGCSLHFHIGGMPRTMEFILAFYKLMSFFQNDIFSMFPLYKKYNFGVKRKNYSAPFPIEEVNFRMDPIINWNDKKMIIRNFNLLFVYLSGGHSIEEYNNDLNNIQGHPQDPAGNAKWNIKHRYSFINFIPLIFGNRQTIEFRIHTPTYDINKIMDFLMLNTFLIDYTVTNYKKILMGSDALFRHPNLHLFLEDYLSKNNFNNNKNIYNELSHYISERRSSNEHLSREKGIVYPECDVRTTNYLRFETYKFKRGIRIDSPFGAYEVEDDGFLTFYDAGSLNTKKETPQEQLERMSREIIEQRDRVRKDSITKKRNPYVPGKQRAGIPKPQGWGPGINEQIQKTETWSIERMEISNSWAESMITGAPESKDEELKQEGDESNIL